MNIQPVNVCDELCPCPAHITPATHVPCCPVHRVPLVLAERVGYGQCPSMSRQDSVPRIGGQRWELKSCTNWAVSSWQWVHRETFDTRDVPPWNGLRPPVYPDGLFAGPALEFAPTF